MNQQELEQLLVQQEGPTLEFKRQFYNIDNSAKQVQKWQIDELIRDIVSLANGNPSVAGTVAHLIIGAEDILPLDGDRTLYDVTGTIPTEKQILQWVNSACDPPLDRLRLDHLSIQGKRLIVITIPASPHVHEITRQLQTGPKKYYSEYSVFMRQGESIEIASAKDREAIHKRKNDYFTERRNAPPVLGGAIVGGVSSGFMVKSVTTIFTEDKVKQNGYAIAAGILGAGAGIFMGDSYKQTRELLHEMSTMRRREQVAIVSFIGGFAIVFQQIVQRLAAKRP